MHRAAPVTVEGSAVFPGRPDDARQAIGERHGGHVVPSVAFALKGPLPEVIQGTAGALLAMRSQQCRGVPPGGFTIRWRNHNVSMERLGTLFEEIVEIIREHGPGGGEAHDNIRLELL